MVIKRILSAFIQFVVSPATGYFAYQVLNFASRPVGVVEDLELLKLSPINAVLIGAVLNGIPIVACVLLAMLTRVFFKLDPIRNQNNFVDVNNRIIWNTLEQLVIMLPNLLAFAGQKHVVTD